MLQSDLCAVIQWAWKYMKLNEENYGIGVTIKQSYTLLSGGLHEPSGDLPQRSDNIRDLCVTVERKFAWSVHVNKMSMWLAECAHACSRLFNLGIMKLSSFSTPPSLGPHLKCGWSLWSSNKKQAILWIEAPRRSITKKINGMMWLDYWALLSLKSILCKRYVICAIINIYHHSYPHVISIMFTINPRLQMVQLYSIFSWKKLKKRKTPQLSSST